MNGIERMIRALHKSAALGMWDGRAETAYFRACRRVDAEKGVQAIYTRDSGYHTSGWWKNPDYERCCHLSLSFFDPETGEPRLREPHLTGRLLAGLFGRDRRLVWTEPPYSAEGKRKDVWHYRLFCDPAWNAVKPRGEVYGRELTEAGWLSYSDVRAALGAEQDVHRQQMELWIAGRRKGQP